VQSVVSYGLSSSGLWVFAKHVYSMIQWFSDVCKFDNALILGIL
jgi:hypothetical protein